MASEFCACGCPTLAGGDSAYRRLLYCGFLALRDLDTYGL
jgi:hypothetical protein